MGIHARRKRKLFSRSKSSQKVLNHDVDTYRPVQHYFNHPIDLRDSDSKKHNTFINDEEIPSSDEEIRTHSSMSSRESDVEETVQEMKVRLAKEYLKKIEEEKNNRTESSDENDDDNNEKDTVGYKLKKGRLAQHGLLQRNIAMMVQRAFESQNNDVAKNNADVNISFTKLESVPTSLSLSSYLYISFKSGSVSQYSTTEQKHIRQIVEPYDFSKKGTFINKKKKNTDKDYNPHEKNIEYTRKNCEVWSVVSEGRYVCVGTGDGYVRVYDIEYCEYEDNDENDKEKVFWGKKK